MLSLGVHSAEVSVLQLGLNKVLPRLTPLSVDGMFGPKTDERVRHFQSAKQLKPDGIAGPLTLNGLFARKSLEATVLITPSSLRRSAFRSGFGIQPPNLLPKRSDQLFTDPRDIAWGLQWTEFMNWMARRPPKGPMPPMPSPTPPSAADPKPPILGPGIVIQVPTVTPRTEAKAPLPNTGGNIEVKFEGGATFTPTERLKPKMQEYKLQVDFAKLLGITEIDGLGFELDNKQEDNGDSKVEVTIKVKGSPFLKTGESSVFSAKAFPLLTTAVNTPFDEASGFIGVGGLVQIKPLGRGFVIEIGGKLGAKGSIKSNEAGSVVSGYPVHVEGSAGLSVEFV